MAWVLEASGLAISFGAVVAADDVSVVVGAREIVGMIGANGAGKTTFVNMVTGHLSPSRGTIRFLGRDITHQRSRAIARQGVCRSFQIPQLFGDLSVLDNLLVAIGVIRPTLRSAWRLFHRPETLDLAHRTLERYELAPYADSKVTFLPQGMRKLLDIAMATVRAPRLMLLDEPTSGISVDEKFAIMDTLMVALRQEGAAVMFVEHDMEVVERYAERVIAFYEGRIIADGAPEAVLGDADVRRYVVGAELHRRPAAEVGRRC
ncbi:MAG: ABC transporter ATP-binding protein [Geminicoccales bacterium]